MSRIGQLKATLRRRTTSLASWELPKEESTIAPPEVYTNKGEAAVGGADWGEIVLMRRPGPFNARTATLDKLDTHRLYVCTKMPSENEDSRQTGARI